MTGRTTHRCAGTLVALALGTGVAACTGPAAGTVPGSVAFERHGGLAGENTRLTVAPDGTATVDSRVGARHSTWTKTLSADQWRALRASLDGARFENLDARYSPAGTCDDCFVETVRYRGRTVTVEGAGAPAGLSAALRLLDGVAGE